MAFCVCFDVTDEDNCRSYSITNGRNGDARAYLSR